MGDTVLLAYKTIVSNPNIHRDQYIVYSTDFGNSWSEINTQPPYWGDDTYRMYTHGKRLYAFEDDHMSFTDDLGVGWTEINMPEEYCNYFYGFTVFHDMVFSSACHHAQMLKLSDGLQWELSNQGLPLDREVESLFQCKDALFAFVDVHGIYISTDNGNSWERTDDQIPGYYISSSASSGNNMFVTTNFSVYYSKDLGKTWHDIRSNLSRGTSVGPLAISNDTIYLGTYGNGVWKHSLAGMPLAGAEIMSPVSPALIYPNPSSGMINLDINESELPASITVHNLEGKQVWSGNCSSNKQIDLQHLDRGMYIIHAGTSTRAYASRLLIMRH